MDNNEFTQEASLKTVLSSFIGSYAERDKNLEFSDWLEGKLRQEMPEMPEDASKKLASEIIEAVAGYDKTLNELNLAVDAGQSKEGWFAERMADAYADIPMDVAGEKLQQIETGFINSNIQLIQGNDKTQAEQLSDVDPDPVEWNQYSVKDKVYEIGEQAVLSGLAVAANVIKENVQKGDTVDIGGIVGEALQDGLTAASGEVKATVAGAVKVAAVKGLENLLPSDTPTETICDMAGAAVEGAEALFDVAKGESTVTQAMDKVGRAGVAAACRYGAGSVKGKLIAVPVVGPLLVDLLGGLLDHMNGPKFSENVYTVVRDAAAAAWEGIKESSCCKIFNGIKNMLMA